MKSSSLLPLVVLLALGTLAPLAVEGSGNESLKAGACPARPQVRCIRYEEPQCRSDWQCPGKQRCCPDYCGIKCLDPVAVPRSVESKPGKCPVVKGQCMMLNPPNHCETDSQCDGDFKCCLGMCGKLCVSPVRA
ncbi:antileukoproteinase-like [Urocitellus parryii]|uniref:Secretory leukocyte peptidase inhibitor n=1 Tax=Urocitellus parryii TaxID=9999 RepID=A0A8D2KD50_UROPR|nr:antileukoproteinase-like [Urocitellus parryii]